MSRVLMKSRIVGWLPVLFVLGCASQPSSPRAGAPPPDIKKLIRDLPQIGRTAALAGGPEYGQVQLSPDARTLSVVVRGKGAPGLAFFSVPDLKPEGQLTFGEGLSVANYAWVSPDRVLMQLTETVFSGSAQFFTGQLYAVNKDGTNGGIVYGYRAGEIQTGSNIRKAKASRGWASIAHGRPDAPREAVIWERPYYTDPRRRDQDPTRLFKLDVVRGTKDLILIPEGTTDVLFDEAGTPVVAFIPAGEEMTWQVRDAAGTWHAMPEGATALSEDAVPVGSATLERFFVIDRVAGRPEGLIRVDVATGAKTVVSSRAHEAPVLLQRGPAGELAAVVYLVPYPKLELLPEAGAFGGALERLQTSFPGRTPIVTDVSRDGRYAVARVLSDRAPASWYLYDATSHRAVKVVDEHPDLMSPPFSAREAFALRAEDDPELILTGYLTFPSGGTDAERAPTVVLVHGGPAARDMWFFDEEAQVLAGFGYLVLQVNFRGSSGFGKAFEARAYGEWGAKVQDDIAQAVKWGVAEGLVDPERVCIYGVSFGAYSAMMSAIRHPELYKCAAGASGVYDLTTFEGESDVGATDFGRSYLASALGDQHERLVQQSTLHQVAALEVPVLLAHGALDERTPVAQARALKAAIEAKGGQVVWLEQEGEGHGFQTFAARVALWLRLRGFLEAHLGGGPSQGSAAAPR